MTTILVTRPGGMTDPLVVALVGLGYRVRAVPTVATERQPLETDGLGGFDWIVLTSVQGVDALPVLPQGPKFSAVGEKTAAALRARGVEPSHVPAESSGAGLAASLPDVAGKRIALVRASAADTALPRMLRRRGATVDEYTAYRTVEGPRSSQRDLQAALEDRDLKAVAFASGSAVRGYLALGGSLRIPAITIGPRTTAVARERGFQVVAEASTPSAEALSQAVTRAVPLEEQTDA